MTISVIVFLAFLFLFMSNVFIYRRAYVSLRKDILEAYQKLNEIYDREPIPHEVREHVLKSLYGHYFINWNRVKEHKEHGDIEL